jgi:transposase
VKRMLPPEEISPHRLAQETGVSPPTLSRWLRQDVTLDAMAAKKKPTTASRKKSAPATSSSPSPSPSPSSESEVTRKRRLRRRTQAPRSGDRTPEEKLEIVLEAAAIPQDELGAFLREEGVFEIELLEWRQQALSGIEATPAARPRPPTPAEVKRIRELERELARKEKALAEAAALVVLKKKVQALLGDEDDDTDPTSE